MFANFSRLLSRQPAPGDEDYFVRAVRVRRPRQRSPQVERLLWIGWALIAAKSAFLFWAVSKYHVPFSAWWVVLPTVLFALLCTGIYYFRGR